MTNISATCIDAACTDLSLSIQSVTHTTKGQKVDPPFCNCQNHVWDKLWLKSIEQTFITKYKTSSTTGACLLIAHVPWLHSTDLPVKLLNCWSIITR